MLFWNKEFRTKVKNEDVFNQMLDLENLLKKYPELIMQYYILIFTNMKSQKNLI